MGEVKGAGGRTGPGLGASPSRERPSGPRPLLWSEEWGPTLTGASLGLVAPLPTTSCECPRASAANLAPLPPRGRDQWRHFQARPLRPRLPPGIFGTFLSCSNFPAPSPARPSPAPDLALHRISSATPGRVAGGDPTLPQIWAPPLLSTPVLICLSRPSALPPTPQPRPKAGD